jgi:hypothetical protein
MKDLHREYISKGLPVILDQAAAEWPCQKLWSIDYFLQLFGSTQIEINQSFSHVNGTNRIQNVSGEEFVKGLKADHGLDLKFSDLMNQKPELFRDIDHEWILKMSRSFVGIAYQTFLGKPKSVTRMHAETSFFYVMVMGKKKWTLYSPHSSLLLNPCPSRKSYLIAQSCPNSEITSFECILNKGDVLYVPNWMWHQVENLELSWGVSCRFSAISSILRNPVFAILKLFFSKPNLIPYLLKFIYLRIVSHQTIINLPILD